MRAARVLASLIVAGTLAACGAQAQATRPQRVLHAHLIRPTVVIPPEPQRDHVQNVGDCEQAAAYIHAHGAPGFTVDCPYPVPAGIAANTGPGTVYIGVTDCVAAYENEAANSHGHVDPSSGSWVTDGPVDPFGPCYR